MQSFGPLKIPLCMLVWVSTCPSLVALPLYLHQLVHNSQNSIMGEVVCASVSTRLSSRSDGNRGRGGQWTWFLQANT